MAWHPARRARRLLTGLALGCSLVAAVGPAHAAGASLELATDEQKSAARDKFQTARKAFDDRRFLEALEGFRASYDIVASPNALLMIGESERELGRSAAAYATLGDVAREAEVAAQKDTKYRETVRLARQMQDEVRPKVALLRLELGSAPPGARLLVGGQTVDLARAAEPIAVDPGPVHIVLSGVGAPVVRELTAVAGGDETVSLVAGELEPRGASGDVQRYAGYGLVALGGASLVGTFIAGGVALARRDALDSACGDGPCPPGHESEISSGRSAQTASNVLLVLGLLSAGTGVVLVLTAPGTDDATGEGATAYLRPSLGALALGGRF
ncbi:MAG: hypothetical protein IT373_21550 [Polyangiaceae bacterium]|nr:hypothetical protein [Polyangiaceae bacterium]